MKRMTAVFMFALAVAISSPAEAQFGTNLQFRTPLDYRFSVQPRSHVFGYNRQQHRHHWRYANRAHFYPGLRGPAVIYQNGEIGIPPEQQYTASLPAAPVVANPVVYRVGQTGSCGLQQVSVPGSNGRTSVNIWRC
jgi:hypothetical protein